LKLLSFSTTSTGLTLAFNNPPEVAISSTNLIVNYAGSQCTSPVTTNPAAVTCTI